jgi:hypothetical protein
MPDGMRGDGGGGARRGMCDHSCPFPSASQTVGWHIHIIDCMPSSFAQGVLGTGLLVGGDTYAYQVAPPEMVEKARRWGVLCEQHGVSLAAAAVGASALPARSKPMHGVLRCCC